VVQRHHSAQIRVLCDLLCYINLAAAAVCSVVTVNRTELKLPCFVTSERHRHRNVLGLKRHGVCVFLKFFFLAYIMSAIFYLLRDDVIRSSAINLHDILCRICPSPQVSIAPYSAVCGS